MLRVHELNFEDMHLLSKKEREKKLKENRRGRVELSKVAKEQVMSLDLMDGVN